MDTYQYGIKFQSASWMNDPNRWVRVAFNEASRSIAEQIPAGATIILYIDHPVRAFMGVVRITHDLAGSARLNLPSDPDDNPLLLACERIFPDDDDEPDPMTGLTLPEAGIDLGKMGSRVFEPLSIAGLERVMALMRVRYAQM